MKGFANTKPIVRRKARREITAFKERSRLTEYLPRKVDTDPVSPISLGANAECGGAVLPSIA
jgi:hypothetical protein